MLLAGALIGARADYCPPSSRASDGMRDIMLIYGEAGKWKPDDFLPYVAYLDRQGKPRDWFYDAFLFMMFGGAPSGKSYIEGATNRKDWEFFLDEEFAPGREFAALDATIEAAAKSLGRAPVVPVIVMIPYPSPKQKDFGTVDGGGGTEDFSTDAGRQKAVAWFLRAFRDRWQHAAFRHLKLWGFYWMNEGISPADEAIVKATARDIHSLGLKFHWIPWFNAPGVGKWRDLGFDLVIMQPNYAFIPPSGLLRIPDEDRLTNAANTCRRLGMGIEMELNMNAGWDPHRLMSVDPKDQVNLQLYLDHGDASLDGYQSGAVRAYYQGSTAIASLCRSNDPNLRQLYDDLYRFHKGTYKRRRPYQPLRAPAACLVDGRWTTRPDAPAKAVTLAGPHAALTLDLESARLVGDVRIHFAGSVAPQRVSLALNSDPVSGAFVEVAANDDILLRPEAGGGFTILTFPARLARRMRVDFAVKAGESIAVDEVLLMPTAHMLWGYPYEISANGTDEAHCLTDGVAGGDAMAVWRDGRGEARFELQEAWYAESLRVHFRRVGRKPFTPRLSVDVAAGNFSADNDGWAVVPLNCPVRRMSLRVEDAAAGVVAVDEVALLPAKNLAAGCAYTYDPPFHATYPDDGRKLTDGELSHGFGDGKMVGWAGWSGTRDVTVTVDLGAVRAVDAVEAHVQGGGVAAVHFPERAAASVSDDGNQWQPVAASRAAPEVTESRESKGLRSALGWLKLPTPGAHGRYVRLRLTPTSWLMLSEIRVMSGGENVALRQPYSVQPQPTGGEPYADNTGLLTDGFYSKPGGWKSCAGFNKGEPAVTVDLGATRDIGAARLHVHGGGPGGVWFPSEVIVSTSSDGTSWTPAGTARDHPDEDGKTGVATFMGVTFAPREARWVRFQIKRRGWVMMDELEVIPAARQK